MSDHATGGHPDMDYAEHNRTYAGFLTATKICLSAVILVLVGMYIFLV
jgi:hypothetical protein